MPITSPTDIAGLWGWWDPGLTATADATADGAVFTSLYDEGPGGRDATSVASTPLYRATGGPENGPHAELQENDGWQLPSPAALTAGEIFLWVKFDNVGYQNGWIWAGSHSDTPQFVRIDGHCWDGFGRASTLDIGDLREPFDLGVWKLVNIQSAPNDYAFRVDGVDVLTTATNAVSFGTALQLRNALAVSSPNSVMRLGTVVMYDHKLTDTERTDVLSWMGFEEPALPEQAQTITWSYTSPEFQVTADAFDPTYAISLYIFEPELMQAPTTMTVALTGGVPDAAVSFQLDGVEVLTATTDSDGYLDATSIPVPNGSAGSHTLTAVQIGATTGSATYSLTMAPAVEPTLPGAGVPPADPGPEVVRWFLQDPMPGGLGTWEFPFNPAEADSPPWERNLTAYRTTSPTGQFHIYEGADRPIERNFSGYLPTQEFHDALVAFWTLRRKFYLVDHRKRAWIVTFSNLDMTARLTQMFGSGLTDATYTNWGHDYVVTAVFYNQEPLELP